MSTRPNWGWRVAKLSWVLFPSVRTIRGIFSIFYSKQFFFLASSLVRIRLHDLQIFKVSLELFQQLSSFLSFHRSFYLSLSLSHEFPWIHYSRINSPSNLSGILNFSKVSQSKILSLKFGQCNNTNDEDCNKNNDDDNNNNNDDDDSSV